MPLPKAPDPRGLTVNGDSLRQRPLQPFLTPKDASGGPEAENGL